ncbi:YCF48-related protein [Paraburkholderia agricolaris]|uniref:WD40/YVTN/BNR-like repeat-containing protein n=1 Tax=Paraburkholderia agricolaris TaxID=2152888 RepID=UPI0038BE0771
MLKNIRVILSATVHALLLGAALVGSVHAQGVVPKPARHWPDASGLMLLGAAHAGERIVAVGEQGVVLLSDDDGRHFRQAASVPVDATLTAVTFVSAREGWAVGQWGTVLVTQDGGEHWTQQRIDTSVDQPLFSVAFTNDRDGWAVGLWSLVLATHDGGRTWTQMALPKPPDGGKADRNLYRIFAAHDGALYIAAEQGTVIRSIDGGITWTYLDTGYKGSLWTGIAMHDGRLLVGGLRGNLFQSADRGATWSAVHSGSANSITDLIETHDGVLGVGLDGFVMRAPPGTARFTAIQRPDRAALTAVLLDRRNMPVLFSKSGVPGVK